MASDKLFVDTGAWLAVLDPADQYHPAARSFYRLSIVQGGQFVTTNLVVAETYALIRWRAGHGVAIRFLDLLGASNRLLRVWSTPELEQEAEGILAQFGDQDFSYVDAVSFAAMRAHGLSAAFAFDRHFETAGFIRQPYGGV